MKTKTKTVLPSTVALAATVGFLLLSETNCGDTLEVCQPCGSFLDGDVTISGDPRLDGTFEAVQQIRGFVERAAATLDRDTALLVDTFGLTPEVEVAGLVEEIKNQLFEDPRVTTVIALEPAQCWLDAERADSVALNCEDRLDCNISGKCRRSREPPSCIGFYSGQCGPGCNGVCFVDPVQPESDAEQRACLQSCLGVCSQMDSLSCPGMCMGDCNGPCSAYDEAGLCAGYCKGNCTGTCESNVRFACNGSCLGLCQVDLEEDQMCDGECWGTCPDENGNTVIINGKCRGHVRPPGCDEACGDCREMAKNIAWSSMNCEPAMVKVGLSFSTDAGLDPDPIIAKARVLERVLTRSANDHARLSLLVDGMDQAGELHPTYLVEEISDRIPELSYLDDPETVTAYDVVEDRKFLPLSHLKARLGMLVDTATQGDFLLAAGSLWCVKSAFGQAHTMLKQMIPVKDVGTASKRELVPDRSCTGQDSNDVAPCVYRIVDGQAQFLQLME